MENIFQRTVTIVLAAWTVTIFSSPTFAQSSLRLLQTNQTLSKAAIVMPTQVQNTSLSRDLAQNVDPKTDQNFRLTFYWENDGSFIKRNNSEDRNYTNGTAISLSFQPKWAEQVAAYVPGHERFDPEDTAAGVVFGQLMFTPSDITISTLIPNDRPYAGYAFLGLFWQRTNDTTFDHFQLELGMVGTLSLGESVQKWVHKTVAVQTPMGWDNQVGDEFTVQLSWRRKWRQNLFHDPQSNLPVWAQVIPEVGASYGSVYGYIEGGATFRVGYHLPDDFGPGRLADVASATNKISLYRFSFYGFARLTGRAVEHNIFLDGNNFKDSHGVAIENLVGEAELGFAMVCRITQNTYFQGGYSQTFMTKEFSTQGAGHEYGAFTLGLNVRY